MLDEYLRLDAFTQNHLETWLEKQFLVDERSEPRRAIVVFIDEFPEVLARGDSWPKILHLAEREL